MEHAHIGTRGYRGKIKVNKLETSDASKDPAAFSIWDVWYDGIVKSEHISKEQDLVIQQSISPRI